MSHKRYIELHKESVRNIINPARRQISLSEMIRDTDIRDFLASPKPALAISKAPRSLRVEIQYLNTGYQILGSISKLSVRNNQTIVVSFSDGIRDYFVQCKTKEVYPDRVCLAPVNPRFYQRIKLNCTANIWFLERDKIDQLQVGQLVLRRLEMTDDHRSELHYFARDFVGGIALGQEGSLFADDSIAHAQLVDLSRGGCAVAVSGVSDPTQILGSVAFLETTVRWGRKCGNYSCFIVVKSAEYDADGVRLRCSFLEPLNMLPANLSDGAREFELTANGAKEFIVNGCKQPAEGGVRRIMPLGQNQIITVWPDGSKDIRRLNLTRNSPCTIDLTDLQIVEKSS